MAEFVLKQALLPNSEQGLILALGEGTTPGVGFAASKVFNAVWNDIADWIEVPEDTILEPGRCYVFDGSKYRFSNTYAEKGVIGIHTDTSGIEMGSKGNGKELHVSVAGFVLAFVDKEYEPGTPLTCYENGTLTEMKLDGKLKYPERIVGTFWKPEPNEEWHGVKVNGRMWVKIK